MDAEVWDSCPPHDRGVSIRPSCPPAEDLFYCGRSSMNIAFSLQCPQSLGGTHFCASPLSTITNEISLESAFS